MKTLLIGIGAAGNKAVVTAVKEGVVAEEDAIIINSTSKDFPKEFGGKTIVLSPKDTGCGKERAIAKEYAMTAIKAGKLNIENINNYTTVVIATSVEGGTGSGSTPIIAKFFNQVFRRNTHIIAFTGFGEDVRGLGNTVEFFQEIDGSLVVQIIRNSAFLAEGGNKFKAEKLANLEMCKRIRIITGEDLIASDQNIDDTDILKVSNTSGYMMVENTYIDTPLVSKDDFNKLIRKMIMNTKSVKSKTPGVVRIGVILNIEENTEDAIDSSFEEIIKYYGTPHEFFMQKQWDGNREYISIIASGMQMPIEEIKEIYEAYKTRSNMVNKESDSFFDEMKEMELEEDRFDMIKPVVERGKSVDDFLKQFE